jgi:deferrochelatase/peroxidase EfeB
MADVAVTPTEAARPAAPGLDIAATPYPAAVEFDDIQGLVRFSYAAHREASFLLLRVRDPAAARAWLARAAMHASATSDATVSTAQLVKPVPTTVLQVALTSEGMRALGVPGDVVAGFSAEFLEGMSDPSRSRRLGDVGPSDPARWLWGVGDRAPHVALLLYAFPGALGAWQRSIDGQCAAGFDLLACLSTSDMHDHEPFGFRDGISQPLLDWDRQRPAHDAEQARYSNLSCLGEYLLGYPNEYGGYTDRPLLDPSRDPAGLLARAEDAPARCDLGRNGSYLVLRQLSQDVHGFWQSVDREARGDPAARASLAASMVGRHLEGDPLIQPANERYPGSGTPTELNAFTYRSDPRGLRCPLGAHVRRTNPRNADLPPDGPGIVSWAKRTLGFDADALRQDLVASARFHRLLRRGREYGPAVSLAQALAGAPGPSDTGLHFICLGASLVRQFEFVQDAWVMGTHFDGLPAEGDPLLGGRVPLRDGRRTDGFSMPQAEGPDRRLEGLPRFVTVLGGGYFFLPGVRALRWLATAS